MSTDTTPETKSGLLTFVQDWLPIITVLIGGGWAGYQYWTNRADAERTTAFTRRIEAQRPFLDQKLKLYLEAAQVGSQLVALNADPKSEDWKKITKRFWELRWGELELAGTPEIRQAMRLVGQQIVETEYDPARNRHDLRWAVECLADNLRYSLEQSWGAIRVHQGLSLADTAPSTGEADLPSGCYQGREAVQPLPGMLPLTQGGPFGR